MPRKPQPPAYLSHRGADGRLRARAVLRLPGGKVEERSLGAYGSPESHAAHEKAVGDWRRAWAECRAAGAGAGPSPPGAQARAGPRTVEAVVALFWQRRAEPHYRQRDGSPKGELRNVRDALRPLLRLYGPLPAAEFGAPQLKALQAAMADGSWMGDDDRARWARLGKRPGYCRRVLNRHVWRLKLVFRWLESEGLVAKGTSEHLATVASLQDGELGVRETDDVLPVPEARLAAALAQLHPLLRTMVRVQLLTGMRPGELVRLRPCDLVRGALTVEVVPGQDLQTRGLWLYMPKAHKTAHRKKRRLVLFGREAQELLAPLLEGRPPDAYLFSPAEGRAAFLALRRANRKSKVQPSQRDRRRASPKKRPGARYTVGSYARAVARACERAAPVPPPLGPKPQEGGKVETAGQWRARLTAGDRERVKAWHAEHRFHPHQLRHSAATRLVRQFGENVARIVLGHSTFEALRIYALRDWQTAADALGDAG